MWFHYRYKKTNRKLNLKEDDVMLRNMQACNITPNMKIWIVFTLLELRSTKIVTWNWHMDDSYKGIYVMLLGRYLLTESLLNLKLSEHSIEVDDGHLKGLTSPMVDLGTYGLKKLKRGYYTWIIMYECLGRRNK